MVGRFRNPEKSLVAIKTVLDAGLDAAADALDVAYSATGDMVLDDLGKIYIGRQMRVQGQDLPAIELEATEIEWDAEHGEQEAIWEHSISLHVVMKHSNVPAETYNAEETATIKLMRFCEAIICEIEGNRLLPVGSVDQADYTRILRVGYPDPTEDDEPNTRRAEIVCTVHSSS